MGDVSKIGWTDSTWNPWIGCDKVGPGCDFCYAEAQDNRFGTESHWGPDAPRKLSSYATWHRPHVWNGDGIGKHSARAFEAANGRPRRVFTLSMGDWADKRVPKNWRTDFWRTIKATKRLRWQPCTKRVPNMGKYLPDDWDPAEYAHVGFLVTCVNQEEADRDIPTLLELKARHGFAWVGISYEPALGPVDFAPFLKDGLDWIIAGGESGPNARDDDENWYDDVLLDCAFSKTAFFMKQMAHLRPIPERLMVQEFPKELCR